MSSRHPNTRVLAAEEVPGRWDELLDAVVNDDLRVLVERQGAPAAALISAHELARLRTIEAEAAGDTARIEAYAAAFKDEPPDELEREVANALAEVRAERRTAARDRRR